MAQPLNLEQRKNGNRTTFHDMDEDGMHVATIWWNGQECAHWITANNGGRCVGNNATNDAIKAIEAELKR